MHHRRFPTAVLLLVSMLWIALGAGCSSTAEPQPKPKNIILMIADGCGPASMTMARDYIRHVESAVHGNNGGLALDSIQVGSIQTHATDRRVTDSGAGATAFACGIKTYYTAIAVDTLKQNIATVLEGAEHRGMTTGLVATSRITHATPAAFSAHVPSRYEENEIARQQIGQDVEVIFGGGRRHFLPKSAGGERQDDRNLLEEAEELGYRLVENREAFDAVQTTPVLGLFTSDHMSYAIDRNSRQEPSLEEMTRKALSLLEGSSENGFFLMIEGSRIDHAGHRNDPATHLREILEYDKAAAEALSFARKDGETLVVSVADHETGGLSLIGGWDPAVLSEVAASRARITEEITAQEDSPANIFQRRAGIELSSEEINELESLRSDPEQIQQMVSDIISSRAGIRWSTGGHTAVDVNLYAYGPGSGRFIGHYDNSYIGRTIAELLDINLPQLTRQLRENEVHAAAEPSSK